MYLPLLSVQPERNGAGDAKPESIARRASPGCDPLVSQSGLLRRCGGREQLAGLRKTQRFRQSLYHLSKRSLTCAPGSTENLRGNERKQQVPPIQVRSVEKHFHGRSAEPQIPRLRSG